MSNDNGKLLFLDITFADDEMKLCPRAYRVTRTFIRCTHMR